MEELLIRFSDIIFDEIISTDSSYGVIWKGIYNSNPVAIKMVMIKKGIYYDFDSCKEKHGKYTRKYFEVDETKPFLHTHFLDHRPVSLHAFDNEVYTLNTFSKLNLAPKLYGYCIDNTHNNIHYGFIVMELLDGSVKDIIIHRSLSKPEKKIIIELINLMHHKYKCVHRDLKPSNIGIFLDANKQIIRCVLIDLQSALFKKEMENRSEFDELVGIDWELYKERYKMNIRNR